MATQVASAEIVCRNSNFADAARRQEDEGGGVARGPAFQSCLAWRGPQAPKVR